MVIIPLCSLFPGHTFADTKQKWAIKNSPLRRIADYFQLSKSQLALMDGLLLFINQLGWFGGVRSPLFASLEFC